MKTTDIKQTIDYIQPGEDVTASITNRPMIDLEGNVDKIIAYLSTNPLNHFDLPETITGLTLDVGAGRYKEGDQVTDIPQTTLTLTDNATNYVFIDTDTTSATNQQVTLNTTGFGQDMIPLWEITTASGAVTLVKDRRTFIHKSPQFSGDKVVVTDPNTGELVEHPTVDTTELGYLDGVTSNIQQQLNSKVNTSGHSPNRVIASNTFGQLSTSSITTNELETLDNNTYNVKQTFDRCVFSDTSPFINDVSSTITNLNLYGEDQVHYALRRTGSGVGGTDSYMWIDLYDEGYGRINLSAVDTSGNPLPNTRFEILADNTIYRYQGSELYINGSKVVTEAKNTAFDAARLGGVTATNYARTDIVETFNQNVVLASGSSLVLRNTTDNSIFTIKNDLPSNDDAEIITRNVTDNSISRNSFALKVPSNTPLSTTPYFHFTQNGNIARSVFQHITGTTKFFYNTDNLNIIKTGFNATGVQEVILDFPIRKEARPVFYRALVTINFVIRGCYLSWASSSYEVSYSVDGGTTYNVVETQDADFRLADDVSNIHITVDSSITIPIEFSNTTYVSTGTIKIKVRSLNWGGNTYGRITRASVFMLVSQMDSP